MQVTLAIGTPLPVDLRVANDVDLALVCWPFSTSFVVLMGLRAGLQMVSMPRRALGLDRRSTIIVIIIMTF